MLRRIPGFCCALAGLLLLVFQTHVLAAPKVLGLTTQEAEKEKIASDGGYLMRELFRQAVLIAARDGLGVSTRDEALRESLPGTDADGVTLDLHWATFDVRPSRFWIQKTGDSSRLFEKEFPHQLSRELGYIMNPRALAILVEPLSRTDLVEALKKTGFTGKPNASKETVEVPGDVQQQLQEMNIFSQYAAVRSLHDLQRTEGESPATLAALARGYANLGQLTAFHFNTTHKACRARALLYANRLLAKYHRNAWGLWNRGYVHALVGLPGAALDDLADAHKLNQGATQKREVPLWVPIIEAYCNFNYNTIKEGGRKPETRQLAALLAYLAVENSMCESWAMTTAMQALRGVPECYAICDSIGVRIGGIGTLHRTTVGGALVLNQTLPIRLAQMRNLPPAVKIDAERSARTIAAEEQVDPNWADPQGRRAIVKDLVAAGAPAKDSKEPSWEFLGRMIEDTTLVHAYRRIRFLNDALGLPPENVAEQLEQAREIVADHPYAGLVGYAAISCRQPDAVYRALADVPLKDVDIPLYDVFRRAGKLEASNAQVAKPVLDKLMKMRSCRDDIACDLEYLVTVGKGGEFSHISPRSPLSAAARLRNKGSQFTPEQLKKQEFLGNRHPTWQRALGDRYFSMGDSESAARCYEKYLKLSPDQRGYYKLAEVYWANKDLVKWRETLEESLKAPDTGLTHARTRVSIADHLMGEGKFKEAEPYAVAAAESHAQWALACAVRCYEGLEEWGKANEILETMVRRYPGHEFSWYNWCYVTGHGDLKGATDFMLEVAPAMLKRAQPQDLDLVGTFYLASGRKGLARTTYRRFFERSKIPWAGLIAAVLAEDGRAPKERDKLIAEVISVASTPEAAAIPTVAPFLKLAQWLQKDCARPKSEQPDLASLDAILEPIETPEFLQQINIIARHFQACGQKDLAQQYLVKAEASPRKQKLFYVMLAKMRDGDNVKSNSVADN